jgi:hypothetical protein
VFHDDAPGSPKVNANRDARDREIVIDDLCDSALQVGAA